MTHAYSTQPSSHAELLDAMLAPPGPHTSLETLRGCHVVETPGSLSGSRDDFFSTDSGSPKASILRIRQEFDSLTCYIHQKGGLGTCQISRHWSHGIDDDQPPSFINTKAPSFVRKNVEAESPYFSRRLGKMSGLAVRIQVHVYS